MCRRQLVQAAPLGGGDEIQQPLSEVHLAEVLQPSGCSQPGKKPGLQVAAQRFV
jgi:hypothetical protein